MDHHHHRIGVDPPDRPVDVAAITASMEALLKDMKEESAGDEKVMENLLKKMETKSRLLPSHQHGETSLQFVLTSIEKNIASIEQHMVHTKIMNSRLESWLDSRIERLETLCDDELSPSRSSQSGPSHSSPCKLSKGQKKVAVSLQLLTENSQLKSENSQLKSQLAFDPLERFNDDIARDSEI
jgi:septal ring factor EnvC (AmiA/AmiB activator)